MGKTHWKALGDPNFLGGYDFAEGEKKVLTIKSVKNMEAFNPGDKKKETVRACEFVEVGVKPMIVNVTNAKTISKIFKAPYIEEWANRRIQIYIADVKAFGEVVQALRVRNFLPKVENVAPTCHDCKNPIQGAGNMNPQQMAVYTQKKYGRALCAQCATKEANKGKEGDVL